MSNHFPRCCPPNPCPLPRASEYSDITNITICCGTWNVNTRLLSDSCDMKQWLLHQLHQAADIYAITLQEIVDLNVMNVVVNSKGSDEMALYWQKQIFATILESGQEYRQVFEKHMVGLQVLLFVKAVHLPHIHDIRSIVTYTGGYGVTGNKGGISVRFDFHDSPLCFIGAHFHANRENVMTRNMDWQTILEASVFPPNGRSLTDPTDIRPYSASYKAIKTSLTLSLANHDIFWAGDLNYRITSDIEDEDIFAVVKADNWVSLRGMDQLNQEREKGNVFAAFQEGTIHFPPTYKYQPGTDVYEQRPEKKLRAPAWCDRILWRTAGHKDDIRLVSYDAIRLNISDHKPVVAWFECGMKQFVQDKVRNVYQELLFAVDKWVNASTPKLAVDNRIIDFGDVLLNQKYNNTVTLRNIGTVMAEWTFVPKNDELCVSKPWLKFEPEEGILAPGETTTIKVVLNVTAELAVNGMTEKELKVSALYLFVCFLTDSVL